MGEGGDGHLDESGDGMTCTIACIVLSLSCGGGWVAGEGRDRSSNGTRCMLCCHQAGRGEDKGEGEGGAETRVGKGKNSNGTHQAGEDEVRSRLCLHMSAGEGAGVGKGKGKGETRVLRRG